MDLHLPKSGLANSFEVVEAVPDDDDDDWCWQLEWVFIDSLALIAPASRPCASSVRFPTVGKR